MGAVEDIPIGDHRLTFEINVLGVPDLASYSASTFAVRGLTEALNLEWRQTQRRGRCRCGAGSTENTTRAYTSGPVLSFHRLDGKINTRRRNSRIYALVGPLAGPERLSKSSPG